MEWIQSLNKAIDYIEDNLVEDITCSQVAKHIYISTFHFQRTFNMLTGFTINEYIRNRRLSLAGQELTKENVKVIDIALKYGYETPESFSKAFRRFHKITPNQAKKEGANLKSFNRLVIKIKLEGGNIMDYKIIKKEAFKVAVKTKMQKRFLRILRYWIFQHILGLFLNVLDLCQRQYRICGKEFIVNGFRNQNMSCFQAMILNFIQKEIYNLKII